MRLVLLLALVLTVANASPACLNPTIRAVTCVQLGCTWKALCVPSSGKCCSPRSTVALVPPSAYPTTRPTMPTTAPTKEALSHVAAKPITVSPTKMGTKSPTNKATRSPATATPSRKPTTAAPSSSGSAPDSDGPAGTFQHSVSEYLYYATLYYERACALPFFRMRARAL